MEGIIKNGRVSRTMDVLGIDEEEAISLLSDFWDAVLVKSEYSMTPIMALNIIYHLISLWSELDRKYSVYICEKCGKTRRNRQNNVLL